MNLKINKAGYLFLLTFLLQGICSAQIKLPKLISDGMVLQHSQKLKIWGWAAPNEKVSLLFDGKTYTVKANTNGDWIINLPAHKAGGPYSMAFTASNKVTVNNILFGDVWLCSGQSNMELGMNRLMDTYPQEATASNPNIRQFLVPDVYNFKAPQTDVPSGNWQEVTPKTIGDFSGVAYFFACKLYKEYQIPIGIINAALGGSPAKAWISEKGLKNFPDYLQEAQNFKDDALIASTETQNNKINTDWYNELNKNDTGLKQGWKASNFNDSSWENMQVPGYWASTKTVAVNGAVWFRKTINVPARMANLPAKLILGRIVDADSVFVNDVFVGTTSYQYPPRKYELKSSVLKPGNNTIAIRVISNSGNGGFVLDKDYKLVAGKDTINLAGTWKYKLGYAQQAIKPTVFVRWKPTGLYNAMIAPLQNYTIKGTLWYQGESNTSKPTEYADLMKSLITEWRAGFEQDFPFIIMQLPNFMEEKPNPGDSNWAVLRDQQSNLLSVKNTAMAVGIDLGEWNDIHPVNKKDVGERLALQAEKLVYGNKKVVASGPTVKSIRKDGNKVIVTFNNVGSGLAVKGNEVLKYFAIAGNDGKYVWANATIKGRDEVEVWNNEITNPVYITYAWADNPAGANLYNVEGLPAAPFKNKL